MDRLDWHQINSNNRAFDRHLLCCNLRPIKSEINWFNLPSSWGSTQINKHMGFRKEVKLSVQLDKLKSRTCTITLLLSKLIPLISCSLGFFRHGELFLDIQTSSLGNRHFVRITVISVSFKMWIILKLRYDLGNWWSIDDVMKIVMHRKKKGVKYVHNQFPLYFHIKPIP